MGKPRNRGVFLCDIPIGRGGNNFPPAKFFVPDLCDMLKLRLLFYIAGIFFSSIYCFLNSDQILGALQTVFVDNNWLGFCIVAVRGLAILVF